MRMRAKLFLLFLGEIIFLCFIAHQGTGLAFERSPALPLSPAVKARLQKISDLIVERKSNDEILKVWEKFVDKSRRIDYAACITFVFEEAKGKAESKARLAQQRIDRANALKKAVAEERELIRRLREAISQGKPLGKVPRKSFEIARGSTGRFFIKQAGYISSKAELDKYEGHIQWAGREAELQGTGGVALLEYAKDAIQTAVSNISGAGTLQVEMKKIVERKIGSLG
ncbi:MAG: hypothetical protein OEZ45_13110 [Candidatus Aminicenantes bacterium]|nr:hypothetical protein [Candidatus Aminicenantes bacterium]